MKLERLCALGPRALQVCVALLGLLVCETCLAATAESVVRNCINREESLTSGHIEFHFEMTNGQKEVVEEGEAYFEWAPGQRFRLGLLGEPETLVAVCDGAFCLTEDGTRWSQQFVPYLHSVRVSGLPPEAVSEESIDSFEKIRAMHSLLVDYFLFPVSGGGDTEFSRLSRMYRMSLVSASDDSDSDVEWLVQLAGGSAGLRTSKFFAIDADWMPRRYWVSASYNEAIPPPHEQEEKPLPIAQWYGSVEVEGGGLLPEGIMALQEMPSGELLSVSISLHAERSHCRPIDRRRFRVEKSSVIATVPWPEEGDWKDWAYPPLRWVEKEVFSRVHPALVGLLLIACGIVWLRRRRMSRAQKGVDRREGRGQ